MTRLASVASDDTLQGPASDASILAPLQLAFWMLCKEAVVFSQAFLSISAARRLLLGRLSAVVFVAIIAQGVLPSTSLAGKAFDVEVVTGRELLAYLDHPDWRFRLDAISESAHRKLIQAADKLVVLAGHDDNSRVRKAALKALGAVGSSWWLPTAERVAEDDPEAANRKEALLVIENKGAERSSAMLGRILLNDSDAGVRRKAALILRNTGWPGAEDALAQVVTQDGDPDVRQPALEALIPLARDERRSLLHRVMLDDPDKKVRLRVVQGIAKAPVAVDREPLVAALGDPYSHAARHAARALVALGDRSVAPILRAKALEVRDRKVAAEFNEAAAKLGG